MKQGSRPADLQVHVKGKNFTVSPELRDQATRKMNRLTKYLDLLRAVEVELSVEKTRDAAHHSHVQATTYVAGKTIRVEAVNEEMPAAIDEAVDKLYRQLNRQKERMKSHHGTRFVELIGFPKSGDVDAPEQAVDDSLSNAELRIERLEMEPMFEDEAIEELSASSRAFYVFLNARNEQVNVLYRHEDGSLRLIEPR